VTLLFGIAGADAVTAACFVELCRAGTSALGFEIVPKHAPTYDALRDMMSSDLGMAWAPPLLGAEIVAAGLAEPLVVPVRHGATAFAAAFVVKKSTTTDATQWPSRTALVSLQGKRVAWVDPKSAAGYVLPRLHIASHGFDPAKFFVNEELVGTHLAALDAVVSGRADTCATFCRVADDGHILSAGWLRADGKPIRQVEIAATTQRVPNDAVLASKKLDDAMRAKVLGWMLEPDEGSAPLLLELMTTSTFRIASSDHFAPLTALLEAAKKSGYVPSWSGGEGHLKG
jgi:ABC-type phosphate/phosphonate transport system substrate-binding protein